MAAAPFLLNIAELAVVLRRDRSTVDGMIRDGKLPEGIEVLRINGRRQVRRVDVEAFLGAPITADDLKPAKAVA